MISQAGSSSHMLVVTGSHYSASLLCFFFFGCHAMTPLAVKRIAPILSKINAVMQYTHGVLGDIQITAATLLDFLFFNYSVNNLNNNISALQIQISCDILTFWLKLGTAIKLFYFLSRIIILSNSDNTISPVNKLIYRPSKLISKVLFF